MQNRPLLPSLTGFRALAAYLVLLCHGLDIAFAHNDISYIQPYTACFAYLGMSLFFVLSGFVITYTYYDRFKTGSWKHEAYRFAVARFARLYPLYLFVSILVESRTARHLARKAEFSVQASFVTLTQSWWNVQSVALPQAWSISTEVFFYIVFLVLMAVACARPKAFSSRTLRIMSVATYVLFMAGLYLCFVNKIYLLPALEDIFHHPSNPDVWKWFQYFLPFVRIGEFFLGMLAALLYMRSNQRDEVISPKTCMLITASVAAILAIAYCHVIYHEQDSFLYLLNMNFGYAPFIAYILYATSRYRSALTRIMSHRYALLAGDMSYSIYLLQFFLLKKLRFLFPQSPPEELTNAIIIQSVLTLIPVFMLITIVSYVSYRLIEVPSRRYIRRKLGG